jgi:hypothetical protein
MLHGEIIAVDIPGLARPQAAIYNRPLPGGEAEIITIHGAITHVACSRLHELRAYEGDATALVTLLIGALSGALMATLLWWGWAWLG